jgi:hypothetical protein
MQKEVCMGNWIYLKCRKKYAWEIGFILNMYRNPEFAEILSSKPNILSWIASLEKADEM